MSRQDKEAGNDREVVDELPPVPCDFLMYIAVLLRLKETLIEHGPQFLDN